jgi:hypothetical protein
MKNFILLTTGAIIEFDDLDEDVETIDEYKPGESSESGNIPIVVTYTNVLFKLPGSIVAEKVAEITITTQYLVCSWVI